VDGATLGHIEAVVKFCSHAQPQLAARFQERLKSATPRASQEDIAKARKSKEYGQAHDAAEEELGKIPKEKAGEACRSALEP
jgi:hypothetical protein